MKNKIFFCFMFCLFLLFFIGLSSYAFSPSNSDLINGIDVSEWQGNIDYFKVSNEGIKIVYIKSSEGDKYIDPYFMDNYIKAKENNLKVGFYHYLTARNEEEAIKQANFFASVVSKTTPDCRLAMDFESFGNLSIEQINNISFAFLKRVNELTNKELIIYSDAYNAINVFDDDLAKQYPIWVADYGVSKPKKNEKWNFWVGFQYTNKGIVNGIDGYVDKDYFTNEIFLNEISSIPEYENKNTNFEKITVKKGDTLSQIALDYNTSYLYLAKINKIENPNLIYIGQILEVPIGASQNVNDTSHSIYIVKKGDTLTYISHLYGVTIKNIVQLNKIKNPNLIYAGQILRIPVINN